MRVHLIRSIVGLLCALSFLFIQGPAMGAIGLIVTNAADSGPGTLRNAIAAVSISGERIIFTNTLAGQTILLTNGEIAITNSMDIDGSALSSPVQINGNHTSRIFNITNGVTLNLVSLVLTNGFTNGGYWGGAIVNDGMLAMTNCTLTGNSVDSSDNGGAIANQGALTLDGCTFYGNSAGFSGAVDNRSACAAVNCTFYGNTALAGNGGAIDNSYGASLSLLQCTIAGNTASGAGGGVDNYESVLYLTNTIVAGNFTDDVYCWTNSTNINGGTNIVVSFINNGTATGTNAILTANPLLGALGNHGGPTLTMLPAAGSPAIDAASDFVTNFLDIDQRGYPRLSGAHVDIGAVEAQIPTVAITSPTSGEVFSNLNLTTSGAAGGTYGVTSVYVIDTGGVVAYGSTTNNWTNWTAPILLTPLSNTLNAYAVGPDGVPSPPATVQFSFFLTNFIVVTNKNKKTDDILTVFINDTGPASAPNRVTPFKDGSAIAAGSHVTLTAMPSHNWVLSNWVYGSAAPYTTSQSRTIHFVMQSNFIAEANFVTNVFLAMQGTYYGLFAPSNSPRSQTNSGAISFTLTRSGALSGRVVLGDVSAPLSGAFDLAGTATVPTHFHGLPSATTTLQLDFSNQLATGMISNADFASPLVANLNVYGPDNKATNFAGQYTLAIPGTTNSSMGPLGTGCGTVKISATGAVTFSGALADGTGVTASSGIDKDGVWPLYLPLYKGNGSFWSWNYFDTNGVVSSNGTPVAGASPSWINGGNPVRTAIYRSGFTNTDAVIIGSAYSPEGHPVPADMVGDEVFIEGGNLTGALTNTLADGGALNAGNIVLTVNKNTGAVNGEFLNGPGKIKVNGVLLQGQSNVTGFFLGTNQSGFFQLNQ
jgi:hypothetical protein